MEVVDAKCFLVVDRQRGQWGKSDSLAQAVQNCKSQGGGYGKREMSVVALTCDPSELSITESVDLQYVWPREHSAVRFTAKL